MLEILRNLGRRKLRSLLTISGIVIGIFALTTMGALAEHFNTMLGQGQQYFATNLTVGPPDGQTTGLLPLSAASTISSIEGVTSVYPTYNTLAAPGGSFISMGAPDIIGNETPNSIGAGAGQIALGQGRDLAANGEVMLGSSIANDFKARLGDTVDLPKKPKNAPSTFLSHPFKVVGLMAATGAWTDSMGLVSTADSRMLLSDSLAPAVRQSVDVTAFSQGLVVHGKAGASVAELDKLADRINAQVPSVKASRPSEVVASFKSTGTIFTAVITAAALLALVIGGLSVVNTMIMAVSERVREIGLKKALGAQVGTIMRDYMMEAAIIGVIGGVTGYLLGLGLTQLIDTMGKASNMNIFLVTPRLTVLGIGFAVGMATLAGVIPALRAARMDPVAALRNAG
ncbi:MAG: ABC transporter permease [Candidatus Dormibacteria bacterium]